MTTLALLNEWIGLPENASEHGVKVDLVMEMIHWFMLILGLGWAIFIGIAIWKFREGKNPEASYKGVQGHASTHVEIGVILVEAILLLGFAFPLWKMRVEGEPTGADVVKIRAIGYRFNWDFHYPGEDGVFGRTDPRYFPVNNVGMDPEDPAGFDDVIQTGELVLPVDRKILMDITSKDVIHNLAIVPMRMAQDATPGIQANVWFVPKREGEWDLICGQLCGAKHADMVATVRVENQLAFNEQMKEASAEAYANHQMKHATQPVAVSE